MMRHATPMLCAMLIVSTTACGRGDAATLPTRETFIDVYVDLRVAALRTPDGQLTDSARTAVLEEHGVSAEDLLDFATVRGADLTYMRDLWNEIELRLDSVPPVPALDSASPAP